MKSTIDDNSATNLADSQNLHVPLALSESNSDIMCRSNEKLCAKLDDNIFG